MADDTKYFCESPTSIHVKQEKEMIVPDEVPTIGIKEEEGQDIYYDGLTHMKLELTPVEGGLAHVKQEKEMIVPDEVPTIGIKEEEVQEIYYDGLSHVKQELTPDEDRLVHVKEETEMLVPDEVPTIDIKEEEGQQTYYDLSPSPSIEESNDSDFVMDEQDLDSYQSSSDVEVQHKRNEKKKSKGAKDCLRYKTCHQCPHCDYKSVTSKNLKKHIKAHHTGEEIYRCPQCDFKSVWSVGVKGHITAHHTVMKPHQCSHCDYKSASSEALKKHIARHKTQVLKKHLARHAPKKPHQCPHCDFKFVTSQELKTHMMAQHTDEMKEFLHCDRKRKDRPALRMKPKMNWYMLHPTDLTTQDLLQEMLVLSKMLERLLITHIMILHAPQQGKNITIATYQPTLISKMVSLQTFAK
ncbi:transcriptional repressor CTCF isoform X3 [Halyomorpha halys]|uniref:transcriptional repressor CTCF isoform X3 n=1 Tax=Halyomorpha halys TaxID=286706 RepID=UPI0034D23A3D